MTKFFTDRFPPGFFDLPHSAGETLPLDVIAAWTESDQTRDAARAILSPHLLRGTIVSSDSAGLTRLGRERPLIEILSLVAEPKEIIYAHGRAIGGRAIGVWAADNTQMFFPADIPAERVVAMLRTAMARIASTCELGIGVAAHTGEFYELSGGVYGPDADRVEVIAEEHTQGGELVITNALADALPIAHGFALEARIDLDAVYRVTNGPMIDDLDATDIEYPAPYSSDFSVGLAEYSRTRRDSRAPRQAYQDLAVVLVEREPEHPDIPEVAVLNNLALAAAVKRIGRSLLADADDAEVKSSGLIGIYTFADCRVAIDFARRFREALVAQGVKCRIGIDAGPVLVFDLTPGSREIAGSAVNVASKLAQDTGEYGMIQVSDLVLKRASARKERPTRTIHVSGIDLKAYDL
ncbi:MAG: family 3 adenylate cyclase [Gemmatimonadaceae bacterium]